MIDMHIPPGGGPPPHRHDFEEILILLEGEMEATPPATRSRARTPYLGWILISSERSSVRPAAVVISFVTRKGVVLIFPPASHAVQTCPPVSTESESTSIPLLLSAVQELLVIVSVPSQSVQSSA